MAHDENAQERNRSKDNNNQFEDNRYRVMSLFKRGNRRDMICSNAREVQTCQKEHKEVFVGWHSLGCNTMKSFVINNCQQSSKETPNKPQYSQHKTTRQSEDVSSDKEKQT